MPRLIFLTSALDGILSLLSRALMAWLVDGFNVSVPSRIPDYNTPHRQVSAMIDIPTSHSLPSYVPFVETHQLGLHNFCKLRNLL